MKRLILLTILCMAMFVFGCGNGNGGEEEDTGTGPFEHVCIPINDIDQICETEGLDELPFDDATPDPSVGAVAADFTVETTCGDWNFNAGYSGCESYLFITDLPGGIWDSVDDLASFFAALPGNTQVFFISIAQDPLPVLQSLETNVNAALERFSAEGREFRQARVHYVTQNLFEIGGWISNFTYNLGFGVAIDRQQRIRNTGNLFGPYNFDPNTGFVRSIPMYANESHYFNFEAERDADRKDDGAALVDIFTGERAFDTDSTGQQMLSQNITFPDLTSIDSMELDLSLGCGAGGEGDTDNCPGWDRDVQLFWCDPAVDTDPDGAGKCSKEIGRWITPSQREGRWVHDISGLLPLFQAGINRFSYHSIDGWEVNLKVRLIDKDKSLKPVEVHPLWQERSEFNLTYNDRFDPVSVLIPTTAQRVEVVAVLTGHGVSAGDGCAEFCITDHHFTVDNGVAPDVVDNVIVFSDAGSDAGCMLNVSNGVVPNQFPNQFDAWWLGRAGWCPGKEVSPITLDVTEQVTKGQSNDFEYKGYFNGNPYPSDGADVNFLVTAWLVIYE